MAKKKKSAHYSGIGGQAVLEGVMMKNKDDYAVAIRKPMVKLMSRWMCSVDFFRKAELRRFRSYAAFLILLTLFALA